MLMHEKRKDFLLMHPMATISISFLVAIVVGTILLMLPVSNKSGAFAGLLDCFFTATSAVCVTGLVVVDTYQNWSVFGQVVILLLIQIGGLGLVTITTFFNILMRRKLGFKMAYLASQSVNLDEFSNIKRVLKTVVFSSLFFEIIGMLILSTQFVPKYGKEGLFISLFLSVSAFCNAGFDILGREGAYASLTGYAVNPVVLFTIMGLIIIGGIGFIVIGDLLTYRKMKKLMLHSRIVLITTAALILSGFIVLLLFEWNNPHTLGGLPVADRFSNALFQSVTTRTAGFNTIDNAAMGDFTKLFCSVLMLIGAAPGGTGGGIKVTTFVVIMMTILCVLKEREDTVILKRSIHKNIVYKALSIFVLSLILVCSCTGILMFSNPKLAGITGIDALFESVSAFATVGLSTGVTLSSNALSRIVLIFCMFIGRIGPVSLAVSLALKSPKNKNTVVPEGKILVG